jgi:hypothetical protein
VAYPDANPDVNIDGTIRVNTTSNLQSAGLLLRHLLWIDFESQWRVDCLAGYRFFRASDSIVINDQFVVPILGVPTDFFSTDVFSAVNIFNGGEIGLSGQFRLWYRTMLAPTFKIAFGNVHQTTTITGTNTIRVSGGPSFTTPGGFLAQPTNIGRHSRDQFAVLPELQLNLKYDISNNWRGVFGYTFIYLDKALRSGSAIDTVLNPSQFNGGGLVGQAQPAFTFHSTGYWAQGFNVGLEYRW